MITLGQPMKGRQSALHLIPACRVQVADGTGNAPGTHCLAVCIYFSGLGTRNDRVLGGVRNLTLWNSCDRKHITELYSFGI